MAEIPVPLPQSVVEAERGLPPLVLTAPNGQQYRFPNVHTRSLTLVLQAVMFGDDEFSKRSALALLEYALDVLLGTGGNGQFERHVTANGCRIEAIASIAPIPGDEAREGLVAIDAAGALRDRLQTALGIVDFLQGQDGAGAITSALGYTPEDAAQDLREKIQEALDALPVERDQ